MTEVARPQEEQVPYKDMPPETDWTLSASRINKLQQASIDTLVRRCKQAHFVDVVVRINGKWEVFQADWIKHLETVGPLVQGESFVPSAPTAKPRPLHSACMAKATQAAFDEYGPPSIPKDRICGKPMPNGKGAKECINPPGHEGDCDDMPF